MLRYQSTEFLLGLTEERWFHIVETHIEMVTRYDLCLTTVEEPDLILEAQFGALMALRREDERKYIAVVYKETSNEDGFIITAYIISRIPRRPILWQERNRPPN